MRLRRASPCVGRHHQFILVHQGELILRHTPGADVEARDGRGAGHRRFRRRRGPCRRRPEQGREKAEDAGEGFSRGSENASYDRLGLLRILGDRACSGARVRCAVPSSVAAVIVSSPSTCVATFLAIVAAKLAIHRTPMSRKYPTTEPPSAAALRGRSSCVAGARGPRSSWRGPSCSRDPANPVLLFCGTIGEVEHLALMGGLQRCEPVQRLLPLLQGEAVELGLLLQQIALRPYSSSSLV